MIGLLNIWFLLFFEDTHSFVFIGYSKPSLAQELEHSVKERVEGWGNRTCWVIVTLDALSKSEDTLKNCKEEFTLVLQRLSDGVK